MNYFVTEREMSEAIIKARDGIFEAVISLSKEDKAEYNQRMDAMERRIIFHMNQIQAEIIRTLDEMILERIDLMLREKKKVGEGEQRE